MDHARSPRLGVDRQPRRHRSHRRRPHYAVCFSGSATSCAVSCDPLAAEARGNIVGGGRCGATPVALMLNTRRPAVTRHRRHLGRLGLGRSPPGYGTRNRQTLVAPLQHPPHPPIPGCGALQKKKDRWQWATGPASARKRTGGEEHLDPLHLDSHGE
jgi:hypothetical protein